MLAFRSGTNCSILLMSSPAWHRAARTSSRSISCTLRLRAISYKCHCSVMDVWEGVSGYRRPGGPVTPEAPRLMLNFHFQQRLPTLVPVSRDHQLQKQSPIQKANMPEAFSSPGRNVCGSTCPYPHPSCHQSLPAPQPVEGTHTINAFFQRTLEPFRGQSPFCNSSP